MIKIIVIYIKLIVITNGLGFFIYVHGSLDGFWVFMDGLVKEWDVLEDLCQWSNF